MSAAPLTCTIAQSPAARPRGNLNLHLAPRCGARTRTGCPCRAPAIHGKSRCRMHGGRSTGPRTPEGLARVRAAHTVHGGYDTVTRAKDRYFRTYSRRGSLWRTALSYFDRLPAALQARLGHIPPELETPAYPGTPMTAAQEQVWRQNEAEALAPWKDAIKAARAMGRRTKAQVEASYLALLDRHEPAHSTTPAGTAVATASAPQAAIAAEAHAPVREPPAQPSRPEAPVHAGPAGALAGTEPHAPEKAELRTARYATPRDDAHPSRQPCAAKPHAPDGTAALAATRPGARPDASRARSANHATPHAPVRPVHQAASTPAQSLVVCPAQPAAEPHAPDEGPVPATSATASVRPNRATRRWLRKQERLRQKHAGHRA